MTTEKSEQKDGQSVENTTPETKTTPVTKPAPKPAPKKSNNEDCYKGYCNSES